MQRSTNNQILSLMAATTLAIGLSGATALGHEEASNDSAQAPMEGEWVLSLECDKGGACPDVLGLNGAVLDFESVSPKEPGLYYVYASRIASPILTARVNAKSRALNLFGRQYDPITETTVSVSTVPADGSFVTDRSFEVELSYTISDNDKKTPVCNGIVRLRGVKSQSAAKSAVDQPRSYSLIGSWTIGKDQQLDASATVDPASKTITLVVDLPKGMFKGQETMAIEMPATQGAINFLMQDPDSGAQIGFTGEFKDGHALSGFLLVLDPASNQSAHGELQLRP